MKDLSGLRFNKLTITDFSHSKNRHYYWNCKCECGNEKIVRVDKLKSGHTKSCGCLGKLDGDFIGTRFYNIWNSMKSRCSNANRKDYEYYGKKGISVCGSWLHFDNFKRDMYESYKSHVEKYGEKNTTIERKNIELGYNPSNCRWATNKEQQRNKSSNRLITFRGETLCLADTAKKYNIPSDTLKQRLNNGWSVEKALTKPVRKMNRIKVESYDQS